MVRRSWIHFLYSSEIAYYLEKFIRKNEAIFIVGSALTNGTVQSYDGQKFGQKGKKSLVLLTQSDGNHIVEGMVKRFKYPPCIRIHKCKIEKDKM